ncbi:DUF2829 domain-containing protein [Pectobacterium punjabense]|uniref:DUF2829 domain-containing protein n=1 Tax=Pectobacterium punjabense TaxID=2108399 RepID=UPI002405BE89|nr:DUF2829 domain-containing protein [Pectobacterium punjabense]MDG0795656.1 DUF2829 domain-containing protein [Pectobacterium punjabense]
MTQTNALPRYLPSGRSLYRKKPVVIEARQFNGKWTGDGTEILNWMGRGGDWDADTAELSIRTLEGVMTASAGDWIIKGVKGEFYPCKPDIFAATYEAVEAECIDLEAADFSDALLWLKEGKRVCRAGWNGKGQWVEMVRCEVYQNFPTAPYLGLKNAQDVFVPGWVPSMGDLMATDWLVYDGVAGAAEQQPECSE